MSRQHGLDWKSLLRQKPDPSSVANRPGLLSRSGAPAVTPATPSTPTGEGVSRRAEDSDPTSIQAAAIPILLLPTALPKRSTSKVPASTPAADAFSRLADLTKKAASLVDATATRTPRTSGAAAQLLERPHLLPDPLPPPEHVFFDTGSALWYNELQDNSGAAGNRSAKIEYSSRGHQNMAASGPGSQGSLDNSSRWQIRLGGSSSGAALNSDRMATSLTGQTPHSSLQTTAHSPSMQVQQALARIRQLQLSTEEAFQQGELEGQQDEEASWT